MRSQFSRVVRILTAVALLACSAVLATAVGIPFKKKTVKQTGPLRDARQLLLVVAENWEAHTATLQRYERQDLESPWVQTGMPIPVAIGKSGMAWGRGLHDRPGEGPLKKEGDGKSPAGVFEIGTAFGNTGERLQGLQLPYMNLDEVECVDDSKSMYYNRLTTRLKAKKLDWESYETMYTQPLYKFGAVIEHNTENREPGAGSCIFLHIADPGGAPTTGCTAMPETQLKYTLTWLNPRKRPLLVQLPRSEYERLKAEWQLP